SGIFISPQVGMWFNKKAVSGEGTVTIYSGAGSGEEEERYPMQSWPCQSMPDWIWTFENVITIGVDPSCSLLLLFSSQTNSNAVNVFGHDKIAVFVSGRSNNLQNR
ncbi:hypothetical protein PENTCL1PPCAC_4510, partial [Pristionchus entomophagus]